MCMGTPSGATIVRSTMNGTAESATSMITAPVTAGVNIRRSEARRRVSTNCISVEKTTKLASSPGPPTVSANAAAAKNGTLKFVTIRRPDPKNGNRNAWSMILSPVSVSPVNMTQAKYCSDCAAARTISVMSKMMLIVLMTNI